MKKLLTAVLTSAAVLSFAGTCYASSLPSWYPENVSSFEDYHDESASRVVDDADILTDAEETALAEQISELTAQYNKDFVIYTDSSSYGMNVSTLAADFYQFNGYGFGDDYSGSVLFICMEDGNRQWYSAFFGDSQNYMTSNNLNETDDAIEPYMRSGDYYDAVAEYINCLDIIYGHKISSGNLTMIIVIAAITAVVIAAIAVFIMYKAMKKVRIATEANRYVVPGSFHIRRARDYYLYSTMTRVRRDQNNGGGGGGRSGFSGGGHSSGGRSFSGGGRSF